MLLTRDLRSQQTALCLLPVASFKSPLSLYKELVHIWHAGFYTAARDTHFDFLALVNNRDCVCGSHRTIENTKAILNLLSPWALDNGANRNAHFPVFPCKRPTCTHWKLLSEGSDSNQLAFECFKGNYSVCCCRFIVSTGEGELRSLLCYHLRKRADVQRDVP